MPGPKKGAKHEQEPPMKTCPACDGEGTTIHEACHGIGRLWTKGEVTSCLDCRGTGRKLCMTCIGRGKIRQ